MKNIEKYVLIGMGIEYMILNRKSLMKTILEAGKERRERELYEAGLKFDPMGDGHEPR